MMTPSVLVGNNKRIPYAQFLHFLFQISSTLNVGTSPHHKPLDLTLLLKPHFLNNMVPLFDRGSRIPVPVKSSDLNRITKPGTAFLFHHRIWFF